MKLPNPLTVALFIVGFMLSVINYAVLFTPREGTISYDFGLHEEGEKLSFYQGQTVKVAGVDGFKIESVTPGEYYKIEIIQFGKAETVESNRNVAISISDDYMLVTLVESTSLRGVTIYVVRGENSINNHLTTLPNKFNWYEYTHTDMFFASVVLIGVALLLLIIEIVLRRINK